MEGWPPVEPYWEFLQTKRIIAKAYFDYDQWFVRNFEFSFMYKLRRKDVWQKYRDTALEEIYYVFDNDHLWSQLNISMANIRTRLDKPNFHWLGVKCKTDDCLNIMISEDDRAYIMKYMPEGAQGFS